MKYCECCFIKMVPVKIYVVLTPPRLIFGPNLSDTLIILPAHTLTAFYTRARGWDILMEDYWVSISVFLSVIIIDEPHLCECKYASSCQTSGGTVSRSKNRDMAFNKNNLSL